MAAVPLVPLVSGRARAASGADDGDSAGELPYDAPVSAHLGSVAQDEVTVQLAGSGQTPGRRTPASSGGGGDNAQLLAGGGGVGGAGGTRAVARNAVGSRRYTQPRWCQRHAWCVRASLALLVVIITASVIALAVAFTSGKYRSEAWREFSQRQAWFDGQVLDHNVGAGSGTWRQRYFVVDKFWRAPDGPVILNICGEYTCRGITSTRLFPAQLAQATGALIVSLEHRFYGESVPQGMHLTASNLQLLTAAQGLADLDTFVEWYQKQIDTNSSVSGTSTAPAGGTWGNKWLALGGSYPGAMAAWFRGAYPSRVVGALASSGVVHTILNFTQYDKQVATSAGRECADTLRAGTHGAEAAMSLVRSRLGMPEQHFTDGDVLYFLADVAAGKVQYGHVADLCAAVQVPASGGPNKGPAPATALDVYLSYVESLIAESPDMLRDYNRTAMAVAAVNPTSNMRAWWWQQCSEVGWFQVAPQTGSIRSPRVDLAYNLDLCNHLFGITSAPDVDVVNTRYGYDRLSAAGFLPSIAGTAPPATRIIFTNGGEDPWQWAGVRTSAVRELPATLIQCPGCAHAVDLRTPEPSDPAALKAARQDVLELVQRWLSQ